MLTYLQYRDSRSIMLIQTRIGSSCRIIVEGTLSECSPPQIMKMIQHSYRSSAQPNIFPVDLPWGEYQLTKVLLVSLSLRHARSRERGGQSPLYQRRCMCEGREFYARNTCLNAGLTHRAGNHLLCAMEALERKTQ